MAITMVTVTAVLLLLYWSTHQAKAQEVTISADYTVPPDFPFTLGSNEYRAGSGPLVFTCRVGGAVAFGVTWTSDCDCPVAGSTANPITRFALISGDTGTHTCTVGGGSANITVNIVGAGIHIFCGRSSPSSGSEDFNLPNNGLVVALSIPFGGFRFRIFCRSDSMMENVGDFIGLDEAPVSTGGPFFVQRLQAGEITLDNRASDDVLDTAQQGVYTCRIPDAANITREINVGVYTSTFNVWPTILNPLVFTPGSSSSTLTCTSTTSIATTVTFTRRNSDGTSTTVGPLRDGNSMGGTYELTQTVTVRGASTFDNVLTINQPLADIVGSSFSCSVTNSIGTSTASDTLEIMAVVQITDPGTLTVGDTATLQCITDLTNTRIEWLFNGMVVMTSDDTGATELNLELNPVNQNNREYTCRVTVAGGDSISDVFTVMTQVPTVSVITSTNPVGSGIAGEDYSITCTVMGAETLGATFNIMWLRLGGGVLAMETSTESSLTHTFTPVGESDEGLYTCEATVSSTLLSGVLTPPSEMLSVTVTRPTLTVIISESSVVDGSLTLTCSVTHNLGGSTNYEWTLPDGMTRFIGNSLTFDQRTLSNAGVYSCVVIIIDSPFLTGDPLTASNTREVSIPTPGPVSNIVWVPQSASSVIVSWSLPSVPNGIILGYSVVLERYVGGIIDSADFGANIFTAVFNDLVAETPYNVTVTARNSAGMGNPVEIVNFTVESISPPSPTDVRIMRSNDGTQMTVSWTPLTVLEARSLIQFYRVFYTPEGSSSKRQIGTTCIQSPCDVPGIESTVLIIGLSSGTRYTVGVTIINGKGEQGSFSSTQTVLGVSIGSADNTGAIVGGAVAGLLVIAGAVTAIVIVVLMLRHRDHQSRLSIQQRDKPVKGSEVANSGDLDIKTTECVAYSVVTSNQSHGTDMSTVPCARAAYDQTQQIPTIQEDVTYELIPGETEQAPPPTHAETKGE